MKYLLMIYSNPRTWGHPAFSRTAAFLDGSQDERDEMYAQFGGLMQEIHRSGELISAQPLAAPATTRTVRVLDGVPAVTDGPFAEAKEHLAGYFLVDCDSIERAVEIAARLPDARFARVEVRPCMDDAGQDM